MPGSGDYFNQFLVDDFGSLDRELSGHQWFQKEQERDSQRELAEQNELERDRMEEEKESPAPTTADPFRPTYDRKKSTESKKDRLERIKKEYEHKPFISVGSAYIPPVSWEDLRKRRDRRKQVDMQIPNDSFKGGLEANSPNLTQEVEQNEPTIMPMQRFESVKGFCKKAAWEKEDDSDAADWWKPKEEKTSDFFDSAESWKPDYKGEEGFQGEGSTEGTQDEFLEDWWVFLKDIVVSYGYSTKPPPSIEKQIFHIKELKLNLSKLWSRFVEEEKKLEDWSSNQLEILDDLQLSGIESGEQILEDLKRDLIERERVLEAPSAEELEKWLEAHSVKHFCKKGSQ